MATPPSVTRRGFLLGAAAGLAAGVPLTWLAARGLPFLTPSHPATPEESNGRASPRRCPECGTPAAV